MALLLGAMVGLVLWRSLPFLGPAPSDGLYDSDSAIPVLMANLAGFGPTDWLFWGMDRYGSWPFLLARAAGAVAHRTWTLHGMHVLRTLWMVGGVVPWLGLAGRGGPVAAAGFLVLSGLNPVLLRVLHHQGAVDAWQLPALLWAWWGLRQSARIGGWLALAAVAGALATWTSLVSAPVLAALAVVEGWGGAPGARRRMALAVPVLTGLVMEGTARAAWHQAVRAHRWPDVRTPASLDVGHLLENADGVMAAAWQVGALPWFVAVGVAAVAGLAVRRWRRTPEARTVVGACAAALIGVGVAICVQHVRDNAYHPRYLGLALSFAVLGTCEVLGLGVRAFADRLVPRAAPLVAGVLGLGAVVLLAPAARPDPREEVLRPAAAEISASYPGAVLALSYWRAYAIAALLPPGAVVPVPREGEWNRRPDWAAALRSGRPVLVGSPDRAGEAPPPRLVERGAPLVLVQPDVLTVPPFPGESTGERLSLYRLAPDGG